MVKYVRKRMNAFKRTRKSKNTLSKIQSVVKSALNKELEVKQWQWNLNQQVMTYYGNSTLFGNNNVIQLGPGADYTLGSGVNNSSRIGNKVRVKKAELFITIYPTPFNLTVNKNPIPMDLRLIICHSKQTPTEVIVSNTFFDINGGSANPIGQLEDMMASVNKEIYVVTKDVHFKVGSSNYVGDGATSSQQYFSNNDYKLNVMKKYDITSSFPTNLTWNDQASVPTSFQPTMVLLMARSDGTIVDDTSMISDYQPLQYTTRVVITYTDA